MLDPRIGFLRAQLDEDERVAVAAGGGTWEPSSEGYEEFPATVLTPRRQIVTEAELAPHIARHDPARVLADVAAKQRLLDDIADHDDGCWPTWTGSLAERALACLVQRYAGRDGWDPAWAEAAR